MRTDSWTWLLAKPRRRGNLRDVAAAIRSGQLDDIPAEHKAELVRVVGELAEAGDLSAAEAIRLGELVNAMDEANQSDHWDELPKALKDLFDDGPTPPLIPPTLAKRPESHSGVAAGRQNRYNLYI